MLHFLDLLGTAVFAITGALVAMRARMDLFGIIIISIITANGGGTLRDILIHNYPIFWITHPYFLLISATASLLTCLLIRLLRYVRDLLLVLDALGLAAFTVLGTSKCLALGVNPAIAVIMGTTTGIAGGAMRDLLCGEVPFIFRKEIYATAALIGGTCFLLLTYVTSENAASFVGLLVTFLIRLFALISGFSLPPFNPGKYSQYLNPDEKIRNSKSWLKKRHPK